MNFSRSLRRFMAGRQEVNRAPFASLEANFGRAALIVRFFYLFSIYQIYALGQSLHMMTFGQQAPNLRWPIIWMKGMNLTTMVDVISIIGVGFGFMALWKADRVIYRLGFSLSLLFLLAVPPSLGGTNHGHHAWLWMSICFIFLSSGRTRAGKLNYCLTFAGAQGLLLFFYSMAGFWKIRFGMQAMWAGVEGNFSPRGLALILADRMLQTNTQPLLGPFLVENYYLAWPLFLALIYSQFVAVAVAYRPSLHVLWGLILIGFHIGTFLLMEINFPNHVLLLLLLMVLSPFAPKDWFKLSTLHVLPGMGLAANAARLLTSRVKPGARLAKAR